MAGGRSYNYEEKYAPDALGEETSENARVWKVYLDEAENYDDEMLRGFRDTIDSLLVFVSCHNFSLAVCGAKAPNNFANEFCDIGCIILWRRDVLYHRHY